MQHEAWAQPGACPPPLGVGGEAALLRVRWQLNLQFCDSVVGLNLQSHDFQCFLAMSVCGQLSKYPVPSQF